MTTTDHPLARNAVLTLRKIAALLHAKDIDLPEAVAEVTDHDTLTRIVVERVLMQAGLDVWWSDLVCTDHVQAAAEVAVVADRGVDLEQLYGFNWEPIVGIIKAGVLMDSVQIGAMSAQLHGDTYGRLYADACADAQAAGAQGLFIRVTSDVMSASHPDVSLSPSAHIRFLHGVRVLELAAAWYVLDGVGADPDVELLEPIKRALWPHLPNLNGGAS